MRNAREPKYYHPDIMRGRSSPVYNEINDLSAFFIDMNNTSGCSYITDLPLKMNGNTTKLFDIVIQNSKGEINNLIDVKIDVGWSKPSRLISSHTEWEKRLNSVKGTKTSFKQGANRTKVIGKFSKNLKYHSVFIAKRYIGNPFNKDYDDVRRKLKNVFLYVLSDTPKSNELHLSNFEIIEKMDIRHDEFERLLLNLRKSK
jgi:hypothetical protein